MLPNLHGHTIPGERRYSTAAFYGCTRADGVCRSALGMFSISPVCWALGPPQPRVIPAPHTTASPLNPLANMSLVILWLQGESYCVPRVKRCSLFLRFNITNKYFYFYKWNIGVFDGTIWIVKGWKILGFFLQFFEVVVYDSSQGTGF